jgi:hypothetical protein
MKLTQILATVFLGVTLCSVMIAEPAFASGPSKWFHHQKKNPHQSQVHHAKPAHHATKHKARKHG